MSGETGMSGEIVHEANSKLGPDRVDSYVYPLPSFTSVFKAASEILCLKRP